MSTTDILFMLILVNIASLTANAIVFSRKVKKLEDLRSLVKEIDEDLSDTQSSICYRFLDHKMA